MSDTNIETPCPQKPCKSKPRENINTEEGTNDEVRGRPVLYTGVIWIGILRRFLIPRPHCSSDRRRHGPRSISHVPATPAAIPVDNLLQPPPTATAAVLSNKLPEDPKGKDEERRQKSHSPLATLMSQIREAAEQARQVSGDISALLRDSKESTSVTLSEMRREEAEPYRWFLVSVGGLGGYLAGFRRSTGPRLIYSLTTATAAAAVCYPQEAKYYNAQGLAVAHQCIVYGLKLLRERPQKSLSTADPKSSSGTEKSHFETQDRQKETKPTHNAATLFKKHFGTSEYYFAIFNPKSVSVDVQKEEKKPPESKAPLNYSEVSNRESKGNDDSPPCTFRQGGKLFMQCEKDVIKTLPPNSLPYSPALPVPPKLGNNQAPQFPNESQTVKTNTPEEIIVKSTYHNYDLNNSDGLRDEETENHSLDEATIDKSENSDSDSLANLEPALEIEDEGIIFKYEVLDKNQPHPLNKKLSRFYVKSPEETLASPDKGYDDLYSNRK